MKLSFDLEYKKYIGVVRNQHGFIENFFCMLIFFKRDAVSGELLLTLPLQPLVSFRVKPLLRAHSMVDKYQPESQPA